MAEHRLNHEQGFSFFELIKSEIKEWSMSSSIQGVPSFSRANNTFLRVIWVMALLGATGYSSYLIVLSIQSYLEYPIVTNIYQVSEVPTKFPTITFCNKSPFNTPLGINYTKQVLAENDIDYFNMGLGAIYGNMFSNFIVGTNAYGSPDMTDAERKNLSMSIDEMLVGCVYNQNSCNASDWTWSFNIFYGSCYSFNSGKNQSGSVVDDKLANRAGLINGLYLLLYLGESDDVFSLGAEAGVHLFVNNKSVYNSYTQGYSLAVGKKHQVYVDRVFYENLPSPYSSCTDDDSLQNSDLPFVKQILNAGFTYRFDDCLQVCYNQIYLKNSCNCQDVSGIIHDQTNGVVPCLNYSQLYCDFVEYTNFLNGNTQQMCGSHCPLECNYIEYQLSVTDGDFPTKSYYKYLINQTDFISRFDYNASSIPIEKVKETMLMANINYRDLRYTLISTDAKIQILDLIGSVGGQLGLFIGVSMMTFVEILDLLISIVYILIREKFRRDRVCQFKKILPAGRPTP